MVLSWLGLATVVLSAAGAGAYHLSAGASEALALGPLETPEDPSVPTEMHDRGTQTDCYEPDASRPSPVQAAASDAFCGRLLYEPGTNYTQQSPSDQALPASQVASFDVVYARYVGSYGLGTCAPWCFPGGEPVYRDAHDVGAALGATDNGSVAYEGDQGWQTYGAELAHPHAPRVVQQETGLWEANGWVHPTPDQTFLGFLEDTDGEPIDDGRLETIVNESQALDENALPKVCGYTPDAHVEASTPGARSCEVPFTWQEAGDGENDPYEDPCSAPAYTCGDLTPAWYAHVVCSWPSAGGGCGGPPGLEGQAADPHVHRDHAASSLDDYDVWHWVVAPTPSECQGAQEPGFDVDPPDASLPFLAHDLDVYTPLATAANQRGTENVEALAVAMADGGAPGLPAQPAEPDQTLEGQTTLLAKQDRVEPNAPGDSSQTRVHVDREIAGDACAELLDTGEDPAYVDPWVDVIDARVYRNFWLDSILGVDPWLEGLDRRTYQQPPVTSVFGDANGLYLTSDQRQDASNRPGPWMYSAGGKLGVFSDKDDDGRYDPAPYARLFDSVYETGAYPLFWDMRVDENGIDASAGCQLAPAGDTPLAGAMEEAGYGLRTGAIMVVYKTEPTVLYNWRTSQAFEQPAARQAYVLLSQALHAQRDDPAVTSAIDAALERVPADLAHDDPQVVYPNDWIRPASDFYEQCGYPTGGFHTAWSFTHSARPVGNDTLVSSYVLDNQAPQGVIGAEGPIPAFEPEGQAYAFQEGLTQWFDVDPLDGDPSRNSQECASPPHEGDAC